MLLTRAAVASRHPRHLIHTTLRFALILLGCLAANVTIAVGQSASPRPVARLIASSSPSANIGRSSGTRITTYTPVAATTAALNSAPAPTAMVLGLEQRAFELINAQRVAKGLRPLQWDGDLARLARLHSANMARLDFFNHAGPDGMNMEARARSYGIRGWRALGENIAYNQGFDDPAGFAVERWMISVKHRNNLLSPMWSGSGLGVAVAADGRVFLTQIFIAR